MTTNDSELLLTPSIQVRPNRAFDATTEPPAAEAVPGRRRAQGTAGSTGACLLLAHHLHREIVVLVDVGEEFEAVGIDA